MQFSSKITCSFIQYASQNQIEVTSLLTSSGLSYEISSHPDSWVSSESLERFLRQFAQSDPGDEGLSVIENVGLQAPKLKAWGVLDSVLRMIRSPEDILSQPQRILSHFISPAPPIKRIASELQSIHFEVPFFFEEYPYTFTYLKSCFTSIFKFIGDYSTAVNIQWENNRIKISWSKNQKEMFQKEENYNLDPELIRNIIDTIESNHTEIRDLKVQLENKSLEIERLKQVQGKNSWPLGWTDQDRRSFENHILKLQDYFLRAEQLITILSALDHETKFSKAAMKKVCWNNVPKLFPETVQRLQSKLYSEDGAFYSVEDQNFKRDQGFQLELQ